MSGYHIHFLVNLKIGSAHSEAVNVSQICSRISVVLMCADVRNSKNENVRDAECDEPFLFQQIDQNDHRVNVEFIVLSGVAYESGLQKLNTSKQVAAFEQSTLNARRTMNNSALKSISHCYRIQHYHR